MKKVQYIKEVFDKDGKVKHVVLVYGELTETNERIGAIIDNAVMNKNGTRVKRLLNGGTFLDNSENKSRMRVFNMGWAICSSDDKFDIGTGIRLCKKRFSDSPLTTRSMSLLSVDAASAIVKSEAEYIARNIDKYLTLFKDKKKEAATKINVVKEEKPKFNIGDYITFTLNDDGYTYVGKIGALTNDGKYVFEKLFKYSVIEEHGYHRTRAAMVSNDYVSRYKVKDPILTSTKVLDYVKTLCMEYYDMEF